MTMIHKLKRIPIEQNCDTRHTFAENSGRVQTFFFIFYFFYFLFYFQLNVQNYSPKFFSRAFRCRAQLSSNPQTSVPNIFTCDTRASHFSFSIFFELDSKSWKLNVCTDVNDQQKNLVVSLCRHLSSLSSILKESALEYDFFFLSKNFFLFFFEEISTSTNDVKQVKTFVFSFFFLVPNLPQLCKISKRFFRKIDVKKCL